MTHYTVGRNRTKRLQVCRADNRDTQDASPDVDPSVPRSVPNIQISDPSVFGNENTAESMNTNNIPGPHYAVVTSSMRQQDRKINGSTSSGVSTNGLQDSMCKRAPTCPSSLYEPSTYGNQIKSQGLLSKEVLPHDASPHLQTHAQGRGIGESKETSSASRASTGSIACEIGYETVGSEKVTKDFDEKSNKNVLSSVHVHFAISSPDSKHVSRQDALSSEVDTCAIAQQLANISLEDDSEKQQPHCTEANFALRERSEQPGDKLQIEEYGRGGHSRPSYTPKSDRSAGFKKQNASQTIQNFQKSCTFNSNEDDEDEESEDEPSRNALDPDNGRTLACPFYVRHPEKYRRCSFRILRDIAALKQHLHRDHTSEKLCEHKSALSKRNRNVPMKEKWNIIYQILFPDSAIPASPYADDAIQVAESVIDMTNLLNFLSPKVVAEIKQQVFCSSLPCHALPERTRNAVSTAIVHMHTMNAPDQDATRETPTSTRKPTLLVNNGNSNMSTEVSMDGMTWNPPSHTQVSSATGGTCQPNQQRQIYASRVHPVSHPGMSRVRKLRPAINLCARTGTLTQETVRAHPSNVGQQKVNNTQPTYNALTADYPLTSLSRTLNPQSISNVLPGLPVSQDQMTPYTIGDSFRNSAMMWNTPWSPGSQFKSNAHRGASHHPAPPPTPPQECQIGLCADDQFTTSSDAQTLSSTSDAGAEFMLTSEWQDYVPLSEAPSMVQYPQQHAVDDDDVFLMETSY